MGSRSVKATACCAQDGWSLAQSAHQTRFICFTVVLQKPVAMHLLTLDEADAHLAVMVGRGYRAPVRSLRAL